MNKNTIENIAVVIITRNEEQYIEKTLDSILKQDHIPYRVICVDDASTDETSRIVESFSGVELIKLTKKHESYVTKRELALIVNEGLKILHNDVSCKYVLISGGDLIFPSDYISKMIKTMREDPILVIASGIIFDEYSEVPRGAGRIVKTEFWKKFGFEYPLNYGFEAYLVLKAESVGYKTKVFKDLKMKTQRKTGSYYSSKLYYNYGIALKALGYTNWYTIGRSLLFSRRNPKGGFYLLKGFFSDYNKLYEQELRDYVKKTQYSHSTAAYFQRISNILRH